MKILILTQYFWPENFKINDLALGLKEKGNEVTVLTGAPNYPDRSAFPGYSLAFGKESYNGIMIKRVPVIPRGKTGKVRKALNYLSFVLSAGFFAPFFCREKYDAIFVFAVSPITQALPAILLKKIRNIPLFIWTLDLWPETLAAVEAVNSPYILGLIEGMVKFIYKRCDLILIASEGFVPSIISKGVDAGKIVFLPNWAEEIYKPVRPEDVKLPAELKNLPKGFILMFAGNIGTAQDFDTILAAFAMLKSYKQIHLLVVGGGSMHEKIASRIKEMDLTDQVHLLGAYPSEFMPSFFSLSDTMLVTLKKDPIFSVTTPAKLYTYLSCARPVIGAIDGEGAKLIVASGAGSVCPPGEPEALRDSILKMYRLDSKERENMGLKGREFYESNFDRERLIDSLVGLISRFRQRPDN